jgi:hypothetical protein
MVKTTYNISSVELLTDMSSKLFETVLCMKLSELSEASAVKACWKIPYFYKSTFMTFGVLKYVFCTSK